MQKEVAFELNKKLCEEWKKTIPKLLNTIPAKQHDKIKIDILPVYMENEIELLHETLKKCLGSVFSELFKLEVNLYFGEKIISGTVIPIAKNYILYHHKEMDCVIRSMQELIQLIHKNFGQT